MEPLAYNMDKICVVGGSGFIGTSLVRSLTKEALDVYIIDKNLSEDYPELTKISDVRCKADLSENIAHGSFLINLAAEHRDDVRPLSLYDEVNVQGAVNICDVAEQKDIRFILFTSSVAVYGFAKRGSGESSPIAPFNDYGRTKYEAEGVFREWQARSPHTRTLVIIRPTVVFGERNRGNVYNLLKQIAIGRFLMIGAGANRKSIAYVENLVSFIGSRLDLKPGSYLYNYVDKPDFSMTELVELVNKVLGREFSAKFRIPYRVGILIGLFFDVASKLTGRKFAISAIRVKKFCADSVYSTAVDNTDFRAPYTLAEGLERTIRFEFVNSPTGKKLFFSE